MAYYTAFEVMECSWAELMKQLKSAENLDEVIEGHEAFLDNVVRRALLGEFSKDLLTQIRVIYDRVVEFDSVQSRLYAAAMEEAEDRRNYGHEIDFQRQHTFAVETMPKLETELRIVSQNYQDLVRTFLLQLTVSQDQSLQCLSFRLDFNKNYDKRRADARSQGTSLTFQQQHRN